MDGLDPEDDPPLSLSVFPGLVIVFERKPVDVLICTFSCKFNNFTAHTQIAILIGRILNRHRNARTSFHVLIFRPPFIRVDEDVVAICTEPDGSHLRRAIRHDGGKIEQSFCFFCE